MRFTSAVSCGILRPSQRAFGTYLCVYREEDNHTAPDRKSSGWMILSAMWLRRTVSPAVEWVEDGRFFLFLLHAVRVKKCVAANGHAAAHFLYAFFCIFSCLSAGDIHFRRISSSHIHPCLYTASSPHPVIFPTYFLLQHRCFHRFFLRRSADPPGSPPLHTPNGPALLSPAMFRPSPRYTYSCPRPAILTVASPRPLSGMYAASESLPFERSFRLLYCFANGLPLPVDSDCIQCLMYEKLSCFR